MPLQLLFYVKTSCWCFLNVLRTIVILALYRSSQGFLDKEYANMLVANIGLVYISPVVSILVKINSRTWNTWQTEKCCICNQDYSCNPQGVKLWGDHFLNLYSVCIILQKEAIYSLTSDWSSFCMKTNE